MIKSEINSESALVLDRDSLAGVTAILYKVHPKLGVEFPDEQMYSDGTIKGLRLKIQYDRVEKDLVVRAGFDPQRRDLSNKQMGIRLRPLREDNDLGIGISSSVQPHHFQGERLTLEFLASAEASAETTKYRELRNSSTTDLDKILDPRTRAIQPSSDFSIFCYDNHLKGIDWNEKQRYAVWDESADRLTNLCGKSEIDLVVTDPPWNLGLKFGSKRDNAPHEEYVQMMGRVISRIERVLKPGGSVVMILPKSVRKRNEIYDYPKVFANLFREAGFSHNYHFDFSVYEDDFTCLPANEISKSRDDCHSEEICGLAFSRKAHSGWNFPVNRKYRYASRDGHPCPYSPELVQDILDTFYTEGDRVLDPFMGTGSLGVEVLRRNGYFVGFDNCEEFYKIAKKELREEIRGYCLLPQSDVISR